MNSFTFMPQGPFDLLYQNQYFNGWPTLATDRNTIVMAFPIEGWRGSAAVTLRQQANGALDITVYGSVDHEAARDQALAAMSADEDGRGWPIVGQRDAFVGELQAKYHAMRPTKFHSPYEAAAALILGHRITVRQARAIRAQMSEQFGEAIKVEGETFHAFPEPQKLLTVNEIKGVNETKIARLHAVAQAALDGLLDRHYLQGLPEDEALRQLETLPGIGPFFSQGILHRGAGVADSFTHDDITYYAIQQAYHLPQLPTRDQIEEIASRWRPYRMWVVVLLHVWAYETGNIPKRTFSKR